MAPRRSGKGGRGGAGARRGGAASPRDAAPPAPSSAPPVWGEGEFLGREETFVDKAVFPFGAAVLPGAVCVSGAQLVVGGLNGKLHVFKARLAPFAGPLPARPARASLRHAEMWPAWKAAGLGAVTCVVAGDFRVPRTGALLAVLSGEGVCHLFDAAAPGEAPPDDGPLEALDLSAASTPPPEPPATPPPQQRQRADDERAGKQEEDAPREPAASEEPADGAAAPAPLAGRPAPLDLGEDDEGGAATEAVAPHPRRREAAPPSAAAVRGSGPTRRVSPLFSVSVPLNISAAVVDGDGLLVAGTRSRTLHYLRIEGRSAAVEQRPAVALPSQVVSLAWCPPYVLVGMERGAAAVDASGRVRLLSGCSSALHVVVAARGRVAAVCTSGGLVRVTSRVEELLAGDDIKNQGDDGGGDDKDDGDDKGDQGSDGVELHTASVQLPCHAPVSADVLDGGEVAVCFVDSAAWIRAPPGARKPPSVVLYRTRRRVAAGRCALLPVRNGRPQWCLSVVTFDNEVWVYVDAKADLSLRGQKFATYWNHMGGADQVRSRASDAIRALMPGGGAGSTDAEVARFAASALPAAHESLARYRDALLERARRAGLADAAFSARHGRAAAAPPRDPWSRVVPGADAAAEGLGAVGNGGGGGDDDDNDNDDHPAGRRSPPRAPLPSPRVSESMSAAALARHPDGPALLLRFCEGGEERAGAEFLAAAARYFVIPPEGHAAEQLEVADAACARHVVEGGAAVCTSTRVRLGRALDILRGAASAGKKLDTEPLGRFLADAAQELSGLAEQGLMRRVRASDAFKELQAREG